MADIPRYEMTYDGVTVELAVIQTEYKTIAVPLGDPVLVRAGETFTITGTGTYSVNVG